MTKSEWPTAGRAALGIAVMPLISFYIATAPTVFLLGQPNEYRHTFDTVIVVAPTMLGNLLAVKWSRSFWPHLIGPVILLVLLTYLIVSQLSQVVWTANLPFLPMVFGTPLLSNVLFRAYQKRTGML